MLSFCIYLFGHNKVAMKLKNIKNIIIKNQLIKLYLL